MTNMAPNLSIQEETEETIRGTLIELIPSSKIAWLQEIAFSLTKLIVIIVASLMAVISVLVKANWIDIIIRTGSVILIMGLLGWLFNWLLGKYLVEAKVKEIQEMIEKKKVESTMDTLA